MSNHSEENENGLYKGLLFGVVLGIGLVWFLGTKEGKEIKDELLERGQNFIDKSRSSLEKIDEDEPLSPRI